MHTNVKPAVRPNIGFFDHPETWGSTMDLHQFEAYQTPSKVGIKCTCHDDV